MYKKLTVDDLSVFINTSDNFAPLEQLIYLGAPLSDYMREMNASKSATLCRKVREFVKDTFEDSAHRFDPNYEVSNDYVLRDKPFSMEC